MVSTLNPTLPTASLFLLHTAMKPSARPRRRDDKIWSRGHIYSHSLPKKTPNTSTPVVVSRHRPVRRTGYVELGYFGSDIRCGQTRSTPDMRTMLSYSVDFDENGFSYSCKLMQWIQQIAMPATPVANRMSSWQNDYLMRTGSWFYINN